MSVRSNGDSNNKRVIAGSVVYPAGTSWSNTNWPAASSADFVLSGQSSANSVGVPVYYVGFKANGAVPFKSVPVVTATISGGTVYGLVVRVANVTTSRFKLFVYNSAGTAITLSNDITVNWVATEASSSEKFQQNLPTLLADLP